MLCLTTGMVRDPVGYGPRATACVLPGARVCAWSGSKGVRSGSEGVRTERGHAHGPVARARSSERTALMQDGSEARATRIAQERADMRTRAREAPCNASCCALMPGRAWWKMVVLGLDAYTCRSTRNCSQYPLIIVN